MAGWRWLARPTRPARAGGDGRPAASGADLYVAASGGSPRGISTHTMPARVSVGPTHPPPVVERQRGLVRDVEHEVDVASGGQALLRLAAGRYRLLASNALVITLRSCDAGAVTDVRRVPRRPASAPGPVYGRTGRPPAP